jgi:hypothetical protein
MHSGLPSLPLFRISVGALNVFGLLAGSHSRMPGILVCPSGLA